MSTKLGLHITPGSRNGYGPVAEAAPAVVLSIGDGSALKEAWEKSRKRTITIYRDMKVYPHGNAPEGFPQMTEEEARAAADEYWPRLRAEYEKNPADYYQPTNEIAGGLEDPEGSEAFEVGMRSVRNLIAYEMRLMELSEAEGGRFKLAVASLSGGTPGRFELWEELFVPLIRRAGEGGHIYSRHAYGPGLLTAPGPVPTDGNAGRPFKEAEYLRMQSIHTPMVITEAGPNAGYEFPGADEFMADVKRYDQLCQQYDNIWGFCCWTYGGWRKGKPNIQDASGELAAYLRQQGGAVRPQYPAASVAAAGTASAAEPAPAPDGEPRAPAHREGWIWVERVERDGDMGRVVRSRLKLREEPRQSSPERGILEIGTQVRITGEPQWGEKFQYYPVEVLGVGAEAPVAPTPSQPATHAAPTGQRPNGDLECGIHDLAGADWMKQHGLKGWALHNISFERQPRREDFNHYAQAGIKLLVRLNYGYHPKGNIPLPGNPDYDSFIEAAVKTIHDSQGAWGWIIGNETNNAHEWPGGVEGTRITAEAYVDLYNRIYGQKPAGARIAPQAIDPYNPYSGDSRVYWKTILRGIQGAEFLTVHPKTQDSNLDSIESNLTFGDAPLVGMFQHLRSYQPLLDLIPQRFRRLPVIATEVNPQNEDVQRTIPGWHPELGAEWVRRATDHFRTYNRRVTQPVTGVIFYRYEAHDDPWSIRHKGAILDAVREVLSA